MADPDAQLKADRERLWAVEGAVRQALCAAASDDGGDVVATAVADGVGSIVSADLRKLCFDRLLTAVLRNALESRAPLSRLSGLLRGAIAAKQAHDAALPSPATCAASLALDLDVLLNGSGGGPGASASATPPPPSPSSTTTPYGALMAARDVASARWLVEESGGLVDPLRTVWIPLPSALVGAGFGSTAQWFLPCRNYLDYHIGQPPLQQQPQQQQPQASGKPSNAGSTSRDDCHDVAEYLIRCGLTPTLPADEFRKRLRRPAIAAPAINTPVTTASTSGGGSADTSAAADAATPAVPACPAEQRVLRLFALADATATLYRPAAIQSALSCCADHATCHGSCAAGGSSGGGIGIAALIAIVVEYERYSVVGAVDAHRTLVLRHMQEHGRGLGGRAYAVDIDVAPVTPLPAAATSDDAAAAVAPAAAASAAAAPDAAATTATAAVPTVPAVQGLDVDATPATTDVIAPVTADGAAAAAADRAPILTPVQPQSQCLVCSTAPAAMTAAMTMAIASN